MRTSRSFPALREPVVGWFVLLIAICGATMGLILFESFLEEEQQRACQDLLKQQRAKRALGTILQKDVLLLGHHLHHLALASDDQEVRVLREKMSGQIESAEETLRVLSNGGTVISVMPATFENVDEIRDAITYHRGPHERIVVEVVELVPLLSDLSAKSDALSKRVLDKFRRDDSVSLREIDQRIAFELKAGCALTARAAERANKISYDTARRVAALEQRLGATAQRSALVRYFTVGVAVVLLASVSLLILRQITRLQDNRRRSEADLRRSRATLETILDGVPVGVVVVGPDRKIRKVNAAALKIMGRASDSGIVGRVCHETLCPRSVGHCPIFDLGQAVNHDECILVAEGGDYVPILKTVTPITLDEETVLLEAFFDITEQKRAEKELQKHREHLERLVEQRTAGLAETNRRLEVEIENHRKTETELIRSADALQTAVDEMAKLKDAAEASSQAKSEFLANMSHEIRTPMTAILGFADLLQSPETGDRERTGYVETIRRSGRALLDLINDILDLSKVESGRMVVEKEKCSLLDILRDAVLLLEPAAARKGLELETRHHFPLPAMIRSDPGRLRQIVVNLVGNAIKFTKSGQVRISTSVVTLRDGTSRVHVKVDDTGIGMPAEELERIFDPFTQVDSSASRTYGGTGLGLAVSRQFARLLGGDIAVKSEMGRGSEFTLTIDPGPLDDVSWLQAPPEEATAPPKAETRQKTDQWQGRVLLAEDGLDNQRLIGLLLRKLGLEVTLAENGAVAYREALLSADNERPYDLIFMDMQMPEMDGYEATRQLRLAGWDGPIVALTAHAMAGDREQCISAGCDDYLTKPIDRQRLATTIEGHLRSDAVTPT